MCLNSEAADIQFYALIEMKYMEEMNNSTGAVYCTSCSLPSICTFDDADANIQGMF